MQVVSLFSGCGGFDLGAKKAGLEVVWANDIFEPAGKFYREYFPTVHFEHRDIKQVKDFPEADVLIGCYPCTGFSTASRRRAKTLEPRDLTKNDTNFLFKEFLRAIDFVQPKAIFVENVRGMLSANNGCFLQEQIEGFKSKGFSRIKPIILNAQDYGIAQSRIRVFFAAVHDDYFHLNPEYSPLQGGEHYERISMRDVIWDMDPWPTGEFFDGRFHGHYLTRNRKRGWDEPSFTIVADADHVPLHPSGLPMYKLGVDKWALADGVNRRLSWRECTRIQGLPDVLDIDCSLRDKYRVVGNSVPPNLAYAVVKPIIEFLQSFA